MIDTTDVKTDYLKQDGAFNITGMNKADFLKSFKADIFFDDQQQNIQDASAKVTSAHVPFGIKNKN